MCAQLYLLEGRMDSQWIDEPVPGPGDSARPDVRSPHDVVTHLCALQAQDYLGSLWAIGLRTTGCTHAEVETAIAERTIVRTWPMRGTLHFVAAEDVRWMLDLLAPRVIERSAGRNLQLGLDAETIALAGELFARALEGGARLTRGEMMGLLGQAGISTEGQRGYHLLWHHAQAGLICLGPMEGRQQTFVLLDEWVPPAEPLPRDDGLARIAARYAVGHGPVTAKDLARWSGLTITEARAGLAGAGESHARAERGGIEYWAAAGEPDAADVPDAAGEPGVAPSTTSSAHVHLLPAFDEFIIGYADRRPVLGKHFDEFNSAVSSNGMFSPTVIADGHVVGLWKRTLRRDGVTVAVTPFEALDAHRDALTEAVERYGRFLGLRAELSL